VQHRLEGFKLLAVHPSLPTGAFCDRLYRTMTIDICRFSWI
jgi:hypothetical protein